MITQVKQQSYVNNPLNLDKKYNLGKFYQQYQVIIIFNIAVGFKIEYVKYRNSMGSRWQTEIR
jgi:hypothetical protein